LQPLPINAQTIVQQSNACCFSVYWPITHVDVNVIMGAPEYADGGERRDEVVAAEISLGSAVNLRKTPPPRADITAIYISSVSHV
jgi:hypothetical protein